MIHQSHSVRRRTRTPSPWETLEHRRFLSGTIDFLDTSGPAAQTGDDPRGVITTDVNGDGKLDLVSRYFGPTEGHTGDIEVGLSTGGGFTYNGRWTYGFSAGYDMYFADVDGDGKADLLARYFGTTASIVGDVYVKRSTGSAFSWNNQYGRWTYGWGSTYDLIVRDLTGDGKADLMGRHTGNGDVYVATSDGVRFNFSGTWATGVNTSYQLR